MSAEGFDNTVLRGRSKIAFPESTNQLRLNMSGRNEVRKLSPRSLRRGSGRLSSVGGSDNVISEREEITEMQILRDKGDDAFDREDYGTALHYFSEALKLEDSNQELLSCRAATLLEIGDYIRAQKDVEKILHDNPKYSQAHYLMGVLSDKLHQYKDALKSYIEAIELDSEHEEILSDNIINLMPHFCTISESTISELEEMDAYNKLCEMGTILCVSKKYNLAIRVLNAARKLETNQQGLKMKVLLTLANAQAGLKHSDLAITLYQDCLSTAMGSHDPNYQIKALVSLASLFMDEGETCQAVLYYERLLALEKDIRDDQLADSDISEIWPVSLKRALHMNLSVAYKGIGNIKKAVEHATTYIGMMDGQELSESHSSVGQLHETLGQYSVAVKHYQLFLEAGKAEGDKMKIGTAYGQLGNCYAQLHNWKLAVTYHEQHFNIAQKLGDKQMTIRAAEQLGDTYMMMSEYEKASECYEEMFSFIRKSDAKARVNACCKLGNAFKQQNRYQYGLYYYEEAMELADDMDWLDIKNVCEFHMATILQHSTQMLELEESRKYLENLIPIFEEKQMRYREEDSMINNDIPEQIDACYTAVQNVHNKLGNKEAGIIYAESHRRKTLLAIRNGTCGNDGNINNNVTIEKIRHIVDQQNCTVLYYTVLSNSLLLWVLQPGQGLVRYYSHAAKEGLTMDEQIEALTKEMLSRNGKEPGKGLEYTCEGRALPIKDAALKLERTTNEAKTMAFSTTGSQSELETSEMSTELEFKVKVKSAERQLFDILLSPVDDILTKLEPKTNVLVVPDGQLTHCPFGLLKDWNDKFVYERLAVTFIPCLYALNKVTQSELQQLRHDDDFHFERSRTCMGGLKHIITSSENSIVTSTQNQIEFDYINTKQTSNPRLLKSGAFTNPKIHGNHVTAPSREPTFLSATTKSTALPSPPQTVNLKSRRPQGSPTSLDRMVKVGSLSTLTRNTSTGTDIVTSKEVVVEYKQISSQERCFICGNPALPEKLELNESVWQPTHQLSQAQQEAFAVSEYMDCAAVVGNQLTKNTFLEEVKKATVVHIATYGCLKEGCLVMAPNPHRLDSDVVPQDSYLVTSEDISNVALTAKLVVLSSGWSNHKRDEPIDTKWLLPSVFLAAGAHCILHLLWPVSDSVLMKFYSHFYKSLQNGCNVSQALNDAVEHLRRDETCSDITNWAPFVLIGKDVHVDLKHIHRAMADQRIDKVEKDVIEKLGQDILNPKPANLDVKSQVEYKQGMQESISELLRHHKYQPFVISSLIELLDKALKCLHSPDLTNTPTQLPDKLVHAQGTLRLLNLLGFHFQADGPNLTAPYVVFPYSNEDDLVLPVYDALKACSDLVKDAKAVQALQELLPLTQDNLSKLIDMLSITKHATELQLKVTDVSIRPLWQQPKGNTLLRALGFHQIGVILNFNRAPSNRKLLSACLQLLLSMSSNKSNVLMHKLDVSKLGSEQSNGSSTFEDTVQLSTLSPIILPRNQLSMATPWSSFVEKQDEMEEKINLSRSKSDVDQRSLQRLARAKTWHRSTVGGQANKSLTKVGQPRSLPPRVKVIGGASAAMERIPISRQPELDLLDVDQRRDYAHYVLNERLGDINTKARYETKKLYLPYVQNTHV